jgi:DNA replication factor GINS
MDDEINYRYLRKIQQSERDSPVLTRIDSNFYTSLSKYLRDLDERLEKESSSQKYNLLRDEIQNTKRISSNIYEQREKKVLLTAISKARGGTPDLNNLVGVEQELFDSVLKLMKQSREQLFIVGKKEEETVTPEIKDNKKEEKDNSNPIIRVTEDIPEFVGTDTKKYNLSKNDVLSLPKDMSDTLSRREAAKKIRE